MLSEDTLMGLKLGKQRDILAGSVVAVWSIYKKMWSQTNTSIQQETVEVQKRVLNLYYNIIVNRAL